MNTGGTETRAETEGGVGAIPEDPQHGSSSGAGKRREGSSEESTDQCDRNAVGGGMGRMERGWNGSASRTFLGKPDPCRHVWGGAPSFSSL